jgi:dipeptidase
MCTTIAVGKKASSTGSVIVAHSDDDVADERFIRVPATKNNPKNSVRKVYYDDASLGPLVDPATGRNYNAGELYRYIGSSRGDAYKMTAAMKADGMYESSAIGSIPQVKNTYAYYDSNYGVMNEKGLMIGECTCGAKIHPLPAPTRLFYAAELSRVALERCAEARAAVELMGELLVKYGYHGTGETLLVGDANEAWVMEMCGYDPDGADGLWVAKRVPDNEMFVAANQFRIRKIPAKPTKDILFSGNLHEVCQKLGWWSPETGELDWAATVSYGEYSHPYYSLRRVWRALMKAKPSANLPAYVENGYTTAYPFSVVPDYKLSVLGVAAIYRDNYEGTEFDLTKGFAAGPWGDPTRYENNPDQGDEFKLGVYSPEGAWERPISIYRCGMFWINESKRPEGDNSAGVCWLGLDRPATNCLMPLPCAMRKLPECLETMNLADFDLGSTWWAFNFVANYATIKYSCMKQDIQKVQKELEEHAYKEIGKLLPKSGSELDEYAARHVETVHKAWWDLAKHLIVTYNNGCRTTKKDVMQKIDYPANWLDGTNYYDGPTSY